ncbi:unnamed protein product [Linum trigynum]|uniref:GRF-type domain-containing protein n=1 Tax=Linum trigynum TaxID=586398 RepID=A0AAV2CR89_9ROSI
MSSTRRFRQTPGEIPEEISVICKCDSSAIVRTSRTANNPNRKFFGCPKWSPGQPQKACRFFVWHDIQVAIENEKQRYEVVMSDLKMEMARLRQQNETLQDRNNELQEEVAELLVGRSQLRSSFCTEEELSRPKSEEFHEIVERLSLLETIELGSNDA